MADAMELERLRGLYRALGDEELLRLAGTRDGLTRLGQQAVDAELNERGLVFPVEEQAPQMRIEDLPEDDDKPWVELRAFQVPSEAELAFRKLGEHEVPARMDYAERQLEENGPVVRTNWLAVFVPGSRKEEAIRVLRREMNLFPSTEQHRVAENSEGDEEALFPVGTFDEPADAELAQKALREAGVWFRVDDDGLTIEVKPEDVDAALAAIEGGFTQASD